MSIPIWRGYRRNRIVVRILAMASTTKVLGSDPIRASSNPTSSTEKTWLKIFLFCDYETLLKIEKTCEYFNEILDNQFWRKKCIQNEITIPSEDWEELQKPLPSPDQEEPKMYQFNYKKLYFKRPLNRNLAHPMEADTTLEVLMRVHNVTFMCDAEEISIERVPMGTSEELQNDPQVNSCFAIAGQSGRRFVIDLNEIGLDGDFIDHIRPKITISELCCNRNDWPADYKLCMELLKDVERVSNLSLGSRRSEVYAIWLQGQGAEKWQTNGTVFETYESGVRRIDVLSKGAMWYCATEDHNYGPKFTNPKVIITMPDEPQWLKKEDKVEGLKVHKPILNRQRDI